jgi:hypothetical protein
VHWLDYSVHLLKMRLRRGPSGWLTWERDFRFEYSNDGSDRAYGLMTLRGSQLVHLVGPMPPDDNITQAAHRWPSSIDRYIGPT